MVQPDKRITIQLIEKLPALPVTVIRIIKIASDETSSTAELGDVASKDQALSSTILRLVNSAFYGHFRKITSIRQAIVILGFNTVKSLAMGISVFQSKPQSGRQVFDRNRFWVHSIGVAVCAKRLAEVSGEVSSTEAESIFLCGLLHDIGKVVFDNYFNEDYQAVAETAKRAKRWIGDVEKELLGIDHCEAGHYLAQKWQFPPVLEEAIRYHHDIEKCVPDTRKAATLVHAADHICRKLKLGYGGDDVVTSIDLTAIKLIGLSEEVMAGVMGDMDMEKEAIEAFVSGTS